MNVSRLAQGVSIPQAWTHGLAIIKVAGEPMIDQRGDEMTELLGLRLEISRPLYKPVPEDLPKLPGAGVWTLPGPLEDYAFELITGCNQRPAGFSAVMAARALRNGGLKGEDCIKSEKTNTWNRALTTSEVNAVYQRDLAFSYTYGERVDFWGQLRKLEEALTDCPDTRRARLLISRPDDLGLENPPCWQLSEFFIRGGILYQIVDIRSWCFSSAATENLYGWARLSEYLAGQVGAKVGPMIVNAGSAHIPRHDMWWVNKVLEDNKVLERGSN